MVQKLHISGWETNMLYAKVHIQITVSFMFNLHNHHYLRQFANVIKALPGFKRILIIAMQWTIDKFQPTRFNSYLATQSPIQLFEMAPYPRRSFQPLWKKMDGRKSVLGIINVRLIKALWH